MASSSVSDSKCTVLHVQGNSKFGPRPQPIVQPSTPKPVTMQWSCTICTLKNSVMVLVCDACGARRQNMPEIEAVLVVKKGEAKETRHVMITRSKVENKKMTPAPIPAEASGNVRRKVLQDLDNVSGKSTRKLKPNSQSQQEVELVGIGIQNLTLAQRPEVTNKEGSTPVGHEIRTKQDFNNSWNCKACTLLNPYDAKICRACSHPQTNKTSPPMEKLMLTRRISNDPRGPVKSGVKETFEAIISTCGALEEEFVDDSFPPGPKVLFINGKEPAIINGEISKIQEPYSWLRPSEISCKDIEPRNNSKVKWSVMCDNPTPSDIYQGSLGDCWLMGSLAMITERKELLDNIIRTKDINEAGAYIIRLNHYGKWKDVIVDDLLPCDENRRLIYAKGKRKQLWVPLIEKAMAKLHGSYEALIGGSNMESLTTLTGFPCSSINLNSEMLDVDLTWATLMSAATAGFLMGTGTHGRDVEKMKDNENMGLKSKHAYSILEVTDEWGPKLIRLRNPWGKGSWNGDWSPTSSMWTPEMKKALKLSVTEQGTFWICYKDFVKHFEVLDICRIRQNWEYNSFQGIFLPYADTENHPCYNISVTNPTELDITLFQSSWLSRRKHEQCTIPDVALVLFKANSSRSSEEAKNWTLVQYTARVKERDVNLNLMVDPGVYYLIPVSFGHWTTDDKSETFPEFEISIHSSRKVSCSLIRPPSYLLADLIIKVGLHCCDHLPSDDRNVVLYHNQSSQSFGRGSLYIVENRYSDRSIAVELDLTLSNNVIVTRDLKTLDCIPPKSRQIINILTVKDHQLAYKLTFTLRTQILSKRDKSGKHIPELTSNNCGLHNPRPI